METMAECGGASGWIKKDVDHGMVQLVLKASGHSCLDRTGNHLHLQECDDKIEDQNWRFDSINRIVSSDKKDGKFQCLDTLGATNEDKLGIYGCHDGSSQQWTFTDDGHIHNKADQTVCLNFQGTTFQSGCSAGLNQFKWDYNTDDQMLKPYLHGGLCLSRNGNNEPKFGPCDRTSKEQKWIFSETVKH